MKMFNDLIHTISMLAIGAKWQAALRSTAKFVTNVVEFAQTTSNQINCIVYLYHTYYNRVFKMPQVACITLSKRSTGPSMRKQTRSNKNGLQAASRSSCV